MSSSPDRHLWAVVLAGGIGSRFWPASTPSHPKQLLRLASDNPLIRETIDRIRPLIPLERTRVLTSADLARAIRGVDGELRDEHFFLEPRAAGTAPVLAWAAALIERHDPDAIMVSLHADHVIAPAETFREQIRSAASLAARHGRLMTIGAVPNRAETGYGYIRIGREIDDPNDVERGYEVERFVEKPDARTAEGYLTDGGYLWNTGIFVWRVRDLLDQLERHTPEIASSLPHLREGDTGAFFDAVPTLSIDEGLLERSDRVGVLPARFEWDDIGSWEALFRTRPLDEHGNAILGDGIAIDCSGTALYSEEGPVVAFGVEDLVVVRTAGATFVAPRERTGELKSLLDRLPHRLRTLE